MTFSGGRYIIYRRGGLILVIGSCRRCRVINRQGVSECMDIKHTLISCCIDIVLIYTYIGGWRLAGALFNWFSFFCIYVVAPRLLFSFAVTVDLTLSIIVIEIAVVVGRYGQLSRGGRNGSSFPSAL